MCGKRLFFKNRIKLINVAERLWVLDGKPKTDEYHKNHLMPVMPVIVKEPIRVTEQKLSVAQLEKITDHISLTITETAVT
jgi:hypothetical protein